MSGYTALANTRLERFARPSPFFDREQTLRYKVWHNHIHMVKVSQPTPFIPTELRHMFRGNKRVAAHLVTYLCPVARKTTRGDDDVWKL